MCYYYFIGVQMTKKTIKKHSDEIDDLNQDEMMAMVLPPDQQITLLPEETLRLELLNLSKDILLGKAAMRWETHKQYGDVTVAEIIHEAECMFAFVRGDK
jgi:hypothetical protein